MNSLGKKLRIAFEDLLKGNWDAFSINLMEVLYFLQGYLLLETGTVTRIIEALYISESSLYLEENPDGTHTLYCADEIVETFQVSEVIAWIWRQFLRDEYLCEYGTLVDPLQIYKKISNISIPYIWEDIWIVISHSKGKCNIIRDKLYSFQENESGEMELFEEELFQKKEKKNPIIRNVKSELFYSSKKNCIYCQLLNECSYVCYNLKKKKIEYTMEGTLIGVSLDGTVWFWDMDGNLCSLYEDSIRQHRDECNDCLVYMYADGVKCFPPPHKKGMKTPFMLDRHGEKKDCGQAGKNGYTWMTIWVGIEPDLDFGKRNFEKALNQEKYSTQPFPFTWEEIKKHFSDMKGITPEMWEYMKCVFDL